jgi:hypothetical protein
MRHLGRLALLLVLAEGPGLALAGEPGVAPPRVVAAPAHAAQSYKVTARSLASVSVDGGRAEGLRPGDRLRVVAGEATIAELEVVSVAERSASCRTISATRPVAVGDVVVPAGRMPPSSRTPGSAARPPAATAPDPPTHEAAPPSAPAPAPEAAASPASTRTPASTPIPASTAATAPAPSPVPKAVAPAQVSGASAPSPAPSGPRLTVKYRSATNVYLDAGRAAGLNVGDRLRVVSGKDSVGELEVVYVAEQSASCKVLSETRPVRAGDQVVLVTRVPAPAAPAPQPPPAAASTPAAQPAAASVAPATPAPTYPGKPVAPWARVRGAASIGYYQVSDNTESNYDFKETTARLDLGVYDMGGQPLSFTLRGRSRKDARARALSDRTPQDERTDRLYEVALRYEPPSDKVAFEAGRIGIYRFVGVGYLDGALARYRPAREVQVGAFGGRVAEVDGLGFNGTGSKYGGFVRLVPGGRYAAAGYDVMLAYVRENADGDVSREYLSLESRFGGGGRWSLFERAELELNTGWRKDLAGSSTQLSNVSLSGNLHVASSAWAFVSYDGRRNYRYYVNRVVPEDVFDDLLHQGLRAGINLSRPGGFGATAGFGMSLKEPDPRHPEFDVANGYSGNAGVRHMNLLGTGFSVGLDGSLFSNGYTDGGLVTARLGRRLGGGHLVDLSYGRSFYSVKLNNENRTTQWLRLLGRGELGHRVYVQGDFEYDSGDDLKGPRGSLELGMLF